MTVQRVLAGDRLIDLAHLTAGAGELAEVLRAGVLCNAATVEDGAALKIIGDPVDTAMLRAAQTAGLNVEHERASYPKVGEVPFNSERKMMRRFIRWTGKRIAYTKGAPGAVMAHCSSCWNGTQVLPFDDAQCDSIRQAIGQLQSQGMYVLALARKLLPASVAADDQAEENMTFIGLQALIDPPRAEAARAIAQARARAFVSS